MACGSNNNTTLIPQGTWGGVKIQLNVSGNGATASLCCASGAINGPLTVSSTGTFNLTGTYTSSNGPVPVGGFQPVDVTYSGSINGTTMHLAISGTSISPQTFTLTFGTNETGGCICAL